jgi:hypothetical protein
VEGSCEHGDDSSDSVQCWEVLEFAAQLAAVQERLDSMKLVFFSFPHV